MTVLEELHKHADRVSTLAHLVACHLEMPAGEREDLARAARVHDIGKVVVPDEVAAKPGPLDEIEWRLVRWHSQVGERMVLQAEPEAYEVAALVPSRSPCGPRTRACPRASARCSPSASSAS